MDVLFVDLIPRCGVALLQRLGELFHWLRRHFFQSGGVPVVSQLTVYMRGRRESFGPIWSRESISCLTIACKRCTYLPVLVHRFSCPSPDDMNCLFIGTYGSLRHVRPGHGAPAAFAVEDSQQAPLQFRRPRQRNADAQAEPHGRQTRGHLQKVLCILGGLASRATPSTAPAAPEGSPSPGTRPCGVWPPRPAARRGRRCTRRQGRPSL